MDSKRTKMSNLNSGQVMAKTNSEAVPESSSDLKEPGYTI